MAAWLGISTWAGLGVLPLSAQERAWLQVEAQPTLSEAQARASAYETAFPDVVGYSLGSRWYGIALGPYAPEEARARLRRLRDENLIPSDSYVTDGSNFRDQYWPTGNAPSGAASSDLTAGLGGALTADAPFATTPFGEAVALPPVDDITPVAPLDPIASAPLGTELPPLAPTPLPDAALLSDAASQPNTAPLSDAAPLPGQETAANTRAPVVIMPADEPPANEPPAEARASEAALSLAQKMELQSALHWGGFYSSTIDGAFGAGTRNAMVAWQEAQGRQPTGILNSLERSSLIATWTQERAAYGFDLVRDDEAGITAELPLALVTFDRYAPPFVHYRPNDPSGLQIALISQPEEATALADLYATLQSLAALPPEGPRALTGNRFEISGQSATHQGYAVAESRQGAIKGYLVSWPKDDPHAPRVVQQLAASFRSSGKQALDPGMVAMSDADRQSLSSGLAPRPAKLATSGFYVDASGTVATLASTVAQCARVTLDGQTEARVSYSDPQLGITLLRPTTPLSPAAFAQLSSIAPPLGAAVTVAGYAYGDSLPAPVLTKGTLKERSGLGGEPHLNRLSITTLPGDAGGPVLDEAGAVLGMVMARSTAPDRILPSGVEFAISASDLAQTLRAAGLAPTQALQTTPLSPLAFDRAASGMTVLVSCWD